MSEYDVANLFTERMSEYHLPMNDKTKSYFLTLNNNEYIQWKNNKIHFIIIRINDDLLTMPQYHKKFKK